VKEEPQLVPHSRINYFFSLKKIDAANLPDVVPSFLPELDAVVDQLPVEPVCFVTEKNVADFIQYMMRRNRQYSDRFFPGMLRAAIIQFMAFQQNNLRQAATKLTTLSIACGEGTSERACSLGALVVETHGV
jgi:hypothetical protein